MSLGDGGWELSAWAKQRDQEHADYVALVRKWNQFVLQHNAADVRRNAVRPLAANEAQGKTVRQLHRRARSLRDILDQQDGVDRTTIKHLQRIDPDRARERARQAKRQMRQSLPWRIAVVEKATAEAPQGSQGTEIKHHVTA